MIYDVIYSLLVLIGKSAFFNKHLQVFIISLNVTKNQDFNLSLEDTFLEWNTGRGKGVGGQIESPSF